MTDTTPTPQAPTPEAVAAICPECNNTGLRDTGGIYPWGEGIFVPCDHNDPPPVSVTPEAVADLARRLRGEYRIPITDGLGPAGGEETDNAHEFVRHFPSPPIQNDAAAMLEALAADLARQTARADAAERERDELAAALDTLENGAGITDNGNMWRFWAQMARDEAKRAAAAEAKVARLVEALTLAANRLSRRAVEYVPGSRLFIETGEWADEARAAIAEVRG